MIAVFREGWDLMRHAIDTAPLGFWPLVAGTLLSWGVMNRLRYWLTHRWRQKRREAVAQLCSFGVGCCITFWLWPTVPGFVGALAVGIWSPWSYWLATKVFGLLAAYVNRKWGPKP